MLRFMAEPSPYHSAKAQLEWGPSLANAAAVLALAGMVGNVPHPDTALAALTPSLSLFGIGLLLGCIALHVSLAVTRKFARISAYAERLDVLADVKARVKGYESHGWPEGAGVKEKLQAQLNEVERAMTAMNVEVQMVGQLQDWPPRLNIAALTFCALGFCTLLVGHSLGLLWLEPR